MKFTIATGNSRKDMIWRNKEITWEEFLEKVRNTYRTSETQQEYRKLSKKKQDEIKDVGGFVGGRLKDGRRKKGYVDERTMLTLDMDYAKTDIWDYITMFFDFTCCIYSTHKYKPDKPRLRLVIPMTRPVSADEYSAVARKVADDIGIEQFDDTTYEPTRLMYWPSTSADGEYLFKEQEGALLDPNQVLSRYENWKDSSQWPVSSRQKELVRRNISKQADPLEKNGIVGTFCRTYCIQDAIEKFLPEVYKPSELPNRYDYLPADSTAGVVVYDDKFAYSHHATDLACGKLCNAFDIVRLHRLGDKDEDAAEGTPTTKLPSYLAMQEIAVNDLRVKKKLVSERVEAAKEDFTEENWEEQLTCKKDGTLQATIENIRLIMTHDEKLKERVGYNEFTHRNELLGDLTWRNIDEGRVWNDDDDAALRHYLEHVYGISQTSKTFDAFSIVTAQNRFNPITQYLDSLEWDGVKRLDRILCDYLGAEDTSYTRAVTRKTLCAAVARAYNPGCKFDNMLLLVGAQGLGKSYFVKQLGKDWFSDSLTTVLGKEAYEQLQGVWILEMGELAAAKKVEIEAIKHFISKQEDIFREAYGRRTAAYPRRCIFIGTTNDVECLRDRTGNRRFWPVNCYKAHKDLFEDLPIDQIWAEAVVRYRAGEELYLKGELAEKAMQIQLEHTEESDKTGQILEYIEALLPNDWDKMDLSERRLFLSNDFTGAKGTVKRTRVCASEVWCECLGGDLKTLSNMQAREIKGILDNVPGWKRYEGKLRFGKMYGVQKCYVRID